jgi:NADH-quinone oxidoreductase subunit G
MQACANLLILTGHVGRPNNGLIAVWPGANTQGALDLGYSAEATAALIKKAPGVLILAGCNPLGEDMAAAAFEKAGFVVVTSQFKTPTTAIADVVLPQQSFAERDGTFTSGERRVQRFYTAQGVIGDSLPDWKIFGQARALLDGSQPKLSAAVVMHEITRSVATYAGMGYKSLARTERQFPDVGGDDLYYGGTAYQNEGGVGVQWAVQAEDPAAKLNVRPVNTARLVVDGLLVVPTTLLYDRGILFVHSEVIHHRIPEPHARLNPKDAAEAGVNTGDTIALTLGKTTLTVRAVVSDDIPAGVVLLPKCLSDVPGPFAPTAAKLEKAAEALAATGD